MKGVTKAAMISLILGATVMVTGAQKGATANGKSLFTSNKCNSCHSIDGQGIAKTNANSKAPDLSGVGKTHKAAWIEKYLMKEEDINGKKHASKWKGSAADLTVVATWLGQQKK